MRAMQANGSVESLHRKTQRRHEQALSPTCAAPARQKQCRKSGALHYCPAEPPINITCEPISQTSVVRRDERQDHDQHNPPQRPSRQPLPHVQSAADQSRDTKVVDRLRFVRQCRLPRRIPSAPSPSRPRVGRPVHFHILHHQIGHAREGSRVAVVNLTSMFSSVMWSITSPAFGRSTRRCHTCR